MSEQEMNSNNENWWQSLRFIKIFEGFRSGMQPGKLLLALAGILAIFLAGWIMDGLTPAGSRVVVEAGGNGRAQTDLAAYAQGSRSNRIEEYEAFRKRVRKANEERLARFLEEGLKMDKVEALESIAAGEAAAKLKNEFDAKLDAAITRLESRYNGLRGMIEDRYAKRIKDASPEEKAVREKQRDVELADATSAYLHLFDSLTCQGESRSGYPQLWINQLVKPDPDALVAEKTESEVRAVRDKKLLGTAVLLAESYQLAQVTRGQGMFRTLVDFNAGRFHEAVNALIFERDFAKTGNAILQVLLSVCWLVRFHWFFAVLFGAIWLGVWSIFGGAICRITALQSARDETIGPMRALQFSVEKFWGFFSAPLVPLGIAAAICIVIVVCSLLGAIPVVGEILVASLLGLTLVGGFVVTLVLVGLIGGTNLMYPTLAVEGSDGFDALSRSFSYVFFRPWRMGFYTFVAAVYGAICYLFVRFFAFILLLVVHSTVGATVNLDGASMMSMRGKLDAIWPAPIFTDLQPTINWIGLNWSESLAAFLIMIWVALVVGTVMAFLVSFFFSVNTKIYFLLRHCVDATDMEDVYVEQDIEEITSDDDEVPAVSPQEAPAEPELDSGQSDDDSEAENNGSATT